MKRKEKSGPRLSISNRQNGYINAHVGQELERQLRHQDHYDRHRYKSFPEAVPPLRSQAEDDGSAGTDGFSLSIFGDKRLGKIHSILSTAATGAEGSI